ncbi:MAG: hypothetical protein IJ243_04090 [Prevotella sp.]|nr:hypothetical protein [Prevotella sp.]
MDENKRILSVLSKVLTDRRLRLKRAKTRTDGAKKSTPNFSAALTFENLVCLQKRGSRQNLSRILHRIGGRVQDFGQTQRLVHGEKLHKRTEMCNFFA